MGFLGRKSFRIIIKDRSTTDLPKSEAMLLGLISDAAKYKIAGFILKKKKLDKTPNELTLGELKKYLRHDPMKSRKFFEDWQDCCSP